MDAARKDTSGEALHVGASDAERADYEAFWDMVLGAEATSGVLPRQVYGNRAIEALNPNARSVVVRASPYTGHDGAQSDDAMGPEYAAAIRAAEEAPSQGGRPAVPPRHTSAEATSFLPGEDPEEGPEE